MINPRATALTVTPLPAFDDNYLWLVDDGQHAVVVDPGDGRVVLDALNGRGLALAAVLVTHHHPDHVGGLGLLAQTFEIPVYGPRAEAAKIPGLTHLLDDGDVVTIEALGLALAVLAVPGHTLGHIAYFAAADDPGRRPPWLFCGDTLFAAGCGRLFEGTPAQMHASLARLAALPAKTEVFCAHEYTLSNLDFARIVEPGNRAIDAEIQRVRALRAEARPSLPTSIGRERAINPFLRAGEPQLRKAAAAHAEGAVDGAEASFAALRLWKDGHRSTLR